MPAHVLYDIVRKLSDGAQVSSSRTGKRAQVTLRSGRSRFSLHTLPESDFPDLAPGDMSHKFDVAAADLRLLIEKTQFAISTEETRYYLNGIYLHVLDAKLRAWPPTYGPRLALADVAAPGPCHGHAGRYRAAQTVSELLKLVSEASEAVTVELSSVKIRVSTGAIVLTSKLIDGTFPDYQRVIPQRNDKLMIVERDEFARSVDRVFDHFQRARPCGEVFPSAMASSRFRCTTRMRAGNRRACGRL